MRKLRKQKRIFLIIMMLLVNMLMMNVSPVLASTNENQTTSYFDRLINVLNTNEILTDKAYHELLSNVLEENPYFLVSLNDREIDALEKIYQKIFSGILTIHFSESDVFLTFFGLSLLADLDSLLNNIPVDLYVNASFTLDQNQLNTIEIFLESNKDKEMLDVFQIKCKQVIQQEETHIQQTNIPIRILRYNIDLKKNNKRSMAYSINGTTMNQLDLMVYSNKVVKIKTEVLNGFVLVGHKEETPKTDSLPSYFDFTIDSNRLWFSGVLVLGVGILISYLMALALKTKKQVEA